MKLFWILDLRFSTKRAEHNRIICVVICTLLCALCAPAHSQQVKKNPVVGYLTLANTQRENEQTFERGLREVGYTPGKNILIEWRFAAGRVDRLAELAAELVNLKPDVIVTGGGSECPLALKNATTTIPIVFINISDPVDLGFVKSLAHPGGNITGLSNFYWSYPANN